MAIDLHLAGDVVERGELLNGTQTIVVEGSDEAGAWRVSGDLSWNLGLVDHEGEGALTLQRDNAVELYAVASRVEARPPDDAGAEVLVVTLDIDGGTGEFESARGGGNIRLTVSGESFTGQCTVSLETDGAT